jgi:hypothetical protein
LGIKEETQAEENFENEKVQNRGRKLHTYVTYTEN